MSFAETLYGALPVSAQNLALSLFGLQYRRLRLGGRFDQYVSEYVEREKWSAERLHAHSEDRLHRLLLAAYSETQYYGTRWRAAGIGEGDLRSLTLDELHRIPLTPKADVQANPDLLVSKRAKRGHRLIATRTSGSTGTPTTIYVTADMIRHFMAAREARSFGWAGVSIKLPRSTIGARMVVPRPDSDPPFHRYNRLEDQVYLSAFHLSPRHVTHYVDALNRCRPQVMTGFAHSHYLLAELMIDAGLRLEYRPLAAVLGSEKVWPHMKETIMRGLGAPVFEEYGSVENCVLATECAAGHMHVHTDFGILEVVGGDGAPVLPGVRGRLVCTGLINDLQPLIRYEIGDVGAWSTGGCPCGRDHLPVLDSVVGRQNDAILTQDGRIVIGCDEVFGKIDSIVEGQIVQEEVGRFTIRVVSAEGYGGTQEQQLVAALKKRVGEADIDVEVVREIPRTSSGKFKPVVSRLPILRTEGEGWSDRIREQVDPSRSA